MNDPSAAEHLAEIDARHEAHLSALRQHAARIEESVAADAAALAERLEPEPTEP